MNGPFTLYDEKGRLCSKGVYEKNLSISTHIIYRYEEGNEIQIKYGSYHGFLDGEFVEYDENGDTIIAAKYDKGIPLYYSSENIKMVTENGIEYFKYYEDEVLRLEAYFEKGRCTGLWKIYDEDGILRESRDYNNSICMEYHLISSIKYNYNDRFTSYYLDLLHDDYCKDYVIKKNDKEFHKQFIGYESENYNSGYNNRISIEAAEVVEETVEEAAAYDYEEYNYYSLDEIDVESMKKDFLYSPSLSSEYEDINVYTLNYHGLTFKIFLTNNSTQIWDLMYENMPANDEVFLYIKYYSQPSSKKKKKNLNIYDDPYIVEWQIGDSYKEAYDKNILDIDFFEQLTDDYFGYDFSDLIYNQLHYFLYSEEDDY